MPTEVTTMCFHTHDAVEVSEGSYTFEMPLGRVRDGAAKVALASCEFPMVQWTIEEEWNRLWMSEGVPLHSENNYIDLTIRFPAPGAELVPVHIRLPPKLNVITKMVTHNNEFVVDCQEEHGLAGFTTGRHLHLIGSSGGDAVVLPSAITVDTPHRFRVSTLGTNESAKGSKYVYVPTLPSPMHLCAALTSAARHALDTGQQHHIKLAFEYDGTGDRILITCTVPLLQTRLHILPSPLVTLCGWSTHAQTMTQFSQVWPCESTQLWDYIEMALGFYSPCHRPMCVGQPLRFGPELEATVNRFYFSIGGGSSVNGGDGSHILIFSDPDGHVLTCHVPNGRYSCSSLACHLEETMSKQAQRFDPNVHFYVTRNERHQFVFSCERKVNGKYSPACFALLFNHPLCIDGARLGFDSQAVTGASTYVAPLPTKVLRTDPTNPERSGHNIVRLGELVSQKRFRFHAVAPPPMVGVITGRTSGRVSMQTYVNKTPFAHGYQEGDIVRLIAYPAHTIPQDDGTEKEVGETTAVLPTHMSCLVRPPPHGRTSSDPCTLVLEAPSLDGLGDVDTCVQLIADLEPFNLHVGKTRSIPPHLLGFRKGAILWGIDGTLENDEKQLLPPFEAPYVHSLDHPDYILMTFSESSGAGLEHSFAGETKLVFCKLSLYPLFREERMLPRDTSLLHTNMSRFTLAFWNPDMRTPYKFHGAQFSFSLNFVRSVGDGGG